MTKNHTTPISEIESGNPWYIDDQFKSQWNNKAVRHVIVNRWNVWKTMIINWLNTYKKKANFTSCLQLLDAGCGDGINLIGLKSIFNDLALDTEISGIDYNPIRLKRAHENIEEISILNGVLSNIPFKDDSFHLILCNHVLEHIPDLDSVILEMKRILHPKGLLIVGVPNEGCFFAQMRNCYIQPNIGKTTDHVHFFTKKTLIQRFKHWDLIVNSFQYEGFFLPHLGLHQMVSKKSWGQTCLKLLRNLLPSQSAGLIMACQKNNNFR